MADPRAAPVARHQLPGLDEAALRAARAFDILLDAARSMGSDRWVPYLAPLPDHLRDDDPAALRATARRCRSAFGPGDSVLDIVPTDVGAAARQAVDDLLRVMARIDAVGGPLAVADRRHQ